MNADAPAPYKSTPVFDAETLPAGLRREHRTKAGVWGVIRVLEGELRLTFTETGEEHLLSPAAPGLVRPEEPHFVSPLGAMRMQVDFYDAQPAVALTGN
ncbi:MAG TPA: DUF1971 domain-containing protein [Allosphingosinicella sp.]|jgi:tellurite resistance-related uncharacterized protein|nr:DUF1971 domain-containing protein [Allosphingosinicella sp.]